MRLWKILLSALPVLLVACGGKEPAPDPVKLAANPAELEFGPEGGTQTLTITSGIQPAVSCTGDDGKLFLHMSRNIFGAEFEQFFLDRAGSLGLISGVSHHILA